MDQGHSDYGAAGKPTESTGFRMKLDAGIVLIAFLVMCTAYVLAR